MNVPEDRVVTIPSCFEDLKEYIEHLKHVNNWLEKKLQEREQELAQLREKVAGYTSPTHR